MSRVQYETLRDSICDLPRCWSGHQHTDAGAAADAGSGWRLLLADDHYSECATPRDGGHCDAVGVRPQQSSNTIRLIEIKAKPEKSQNLQRKYDRTGRAVLDALGACELELELHVKPVPKSSQPFQFAAKVNGRKLRVQLWAQGKAVGV